MYHSALTLVDEEKKGFFTRWKILIIALALTVAGLGAFAYWGPGRQMIRSWRAESHLAEAKSLAEAGSWENVFGQADESMSLEPSLEAAQLVAEAAYQTRHPEVLRKAFQLFQFEGATLENRTWAVKVALDLRALRVANAMLAALTPEELKDPEIRLQLVRGSLMTGNFGQAKAIANEEGVVGDERIELLLAMGLAQSGLDGAEPETNERLRKVIRSEDPNLSIKGLELLVSLSPAWLEASLAEEALELFEDQSKLTPFHCLQLEALKVRMKRQELDETVSGAISKYRESDLQVLLSWLTQLQQYSEVVKLTDDPEVQKDGIIFSLRLAALERVQAWETLASSLEEPPVSVPEPYRLALQSLVEKFREKYNQSTYKWKMALVAAQSDPEQNWFYQLSNIAGRAGNRDEQMEALFRAVTHEKGVPPKTEALIPLFQWLAEKNEEKKLLAVSERLLEREPNHPVLLNNFLYLKALYRSADPQDVGVLTKLVEAYPDNKSFHRSLAFVQLMLQESEKALTTLENLGEQEDAPDHSTRAIRARALFSLGKEQEGREIANTIDWEQLNPQQQKVLKLPEPEEEEGAQEEK